MNALLRAAAVTDHAVALLCRAVLVLTGLALTGVLAANVVARYALASGGFDWAQEVPERLFPWFIMAGVALAVQSGGHIAVEWILGTLPRAGRRLLLLAGHLLVIAAYLTLAEQALEVAEIAKIERSPALGLPGSHGYWAVAAGCLLLALGTLTNGLRVALLGPEAMPQAAQTEAVT
jgi:TRAP-type C4-dicarboxylate transport system permease small subunit